MRRSITAAVVLLLATTGCGSATTSAPPAPETTTTSPAPMATPLIRSVLAAPIPVPATDGRTHLAYELSLTNALSGPATLTSLTASAGDRKLLTLSSDSLKYWTRALGDPTTPTNIIGPGQTAIVWIDLALDGRDSGSIPAELTHSVQLSVAKPIPGLIPADVTQDIAPVTVSDHKPASIAPPLDGSGWLDANSCCDMTAHRMAVNPINGKLWLAERFAVDYVQLTDNRLFNGDATDPQSYPYFGTPVHAVGDGKVVAVVDGLPEQVPTKTPSGLSLEEYGGNHIVEDLGDGNYAFYAHLKQGSITVKAGDELKTGQSLGALGNSGNSDAPHLHFHLMDGPDPLMANGLPFVIKSFRLDQRLASMDALDPLFGTGGPAKLQPGFPARDLTETSPLTLDIMSYSAGQ